MAVYGGPPGPRVSFISEQKLDIYIFIFNLLSEPRRFVILAPPSSQHPPHPPTHTLTPEKTPLKGEKKAQRATCKVIIVRRQQYFKYLMTRIYSKKFQLKKILTYFQFEHVWQNKNLIVQFNILFFNHCVSVGQNPAPTPAVIKLSLLFYSTAVFDIHDQKLKNLNFIEIWTKHLSYADKIQTLRSEFNSASQTN